MRDEVQAAIDDLAERLQRSVVVNDPAVHLLRTSRHFGDEDPVRVQAVLQRQAPSAAVAHVLAQGVGSWTAPGVVPADPEIGMQARLCAPVRWHGRLVGLLLVVDADASLTAAEVADVVAVAAAIAPQVDPAPGGVDAEQVARLVEDVLGPHPGRRAAGRDRLQDLLGRRGTPRVHVVRVEPVAADPPPHAGAVLRAALELAGRGHDARHPGTTVLPRVEGAAADVLVGTDVTVAAEGLLRRVEALLAAVDEVGGDRVRCVAGTSGPVADLTGLRAAHRQARTAAVAARLEGAARVWRSDELGALALLLRLPLDDLGPDDLPVEVRRLLAVDDDGRLAATVRTYLDHAGNGPAAAAALHVHRTTLYYRLDRVEALTGLDLADGPTRLVLHLGLRVADLLGHR